MTKFNWLTSKSAYATARSHQHHILHIQSLTDLFRLQDNMKPLNKNIFTCTTIPLAVKH